MSVSICYTARRKSRPSPTEQKAIDAAIAKFAIEDQLEDFLRSGQGYNWESFCLYDPNTPSAPGVIFEGATKLPDNSEDAMWIGIQHWCRLLTVIRHALPNADWHVHVDDHDMYWDAAVGEYDPSR